MKKRRTNKMNKLTSVLGILLFAALPSLSSGADSAYWIYTLQKGDNLWSFAERHLVSPAYALKLKTLNKITDPYNIQANTKLKVPLQWGKKVETSATIAALTGKVSVSLKERAASSATIGLSLPSGSRITTGKNAQATLKFADGSHLVLNSDTSIVLGNQVYYPTTGASANTIDLERGSLNGNIEHPPLMNNRYEIRTKTAITAIKGTELDVSVDGGGATRTSVFSGKVDVSSGEQIVALEQGFGSVVGGENKEVQTEKLLAAPKLKNLQARFEDNLPVVSWNTLDKAKAYKVELYSTKGKSDLLQVKNTNTPDIVLPTEENGSYLVRVYGIPESGLLGLPTEGKFTLSAYPLSPIALSPSTVDSNFSKTVSLRVGRAKEFKGYKLQLTQDKQFKENVQTLDIDPEEPKFVVPESGMWYWRIANVTTRGVVGSYSPINQVRVGALSTKNQTRPTLRIRPINLKGLTYKLELAKRKNASKIVYTKEQDQPEWSMADVPGGKYTAQITYLLNGQAVYQTFKQDIDW